MSEQRYKIYEQLGAGGNGAVFRAYDTQLKRWVAIKRLLTAEEASGSDPTTEELRREADTLASLRNANIVTIFDVAMDDDGLFIVMELLQGPDLADTIAHGPMGLEDFKQLAEQTLEAMLAAHQLRVMHRDIKPENIKVERLPGGRMQAKIIDFGLARAGLTARKQTEAGGTVMGSIYYMAPEQLTRKPTDQRTDLYSLGCVFYETLAGRKAFDGKTVNDVIDKHVDDEVVPLASLCPHLPQWLTYWVMRLMACKPDDRPKDAQQAIEEFRAWEKLPAMPGMAPWMPVPMYGASYGAVPGYTMPVQGYPAHMNPTTGYYPQAVSGSVPVQHVTTGQVPHVTTGHQQARVTGGAPASKKAAKNYGPMKAVPDAAAAKKKKMMIGAGVGVALIVAYLATRGGGGSGAASSGAVATAAPVSAGVGSLQKADDQLFPKDRPFPVMDTYRVLHFVSSVNVRGYRKDGTGNFSLLNSSEPVAVWDDITSRGQNTFLATVSQKPENSPYRATWTRTDGMVKDNRAALDFRTSGAPKSMTAQFTDEVAALFPFSPKALDMKPGLSIGATFAVESEKPYARVLWLASADGTESVSIKVSNERKVEVIFKAAGQTKYINDNAGLAEAPCNVLASWSPAGVQVMVKNARGATFKSEPTTFVKPKSALTQFQVGGTKSDEAFRGWLAEAIVYTTPLKEDQMTLLQQQMFDAYLQAPKLKSLNERLGHKRPQFTDRTGWKITSSHNNKPDELKKLFDGNMAARWSTNENQKDGMHLTFSFGKELKMAGLALDAQVSTKDFPRKYQVEVSKDGQAWSTLAEGEGKNSIVEVIFKEPVSASWLRIRQRGSATNHWSVSEMAIFAE